MSETHGAGPGAVGDEDALLEALKAAPHATHTADYDAPRVRARLRTKAIRVTTSASAGWTPREVEFARAIVGLLDYIERGDHE